MDELSEKLAELLNDPDSMSRVRLMAESLLGDKATEAPPDPEPEGFSLPSGDELKAIMGIMSHLKMAENDSRSVLLNALKPHLSEPRREKVDTAIKILKIIDLLPLIKETGFLNL